MNTIKQLVETIKEGIQEKKGQEIVIADLSEMDGTIAKYFIICQGGSPTQVEAIAESVGDMCRKNLGEKPVKCGRSGQRPVGGYGLRGCTRSHLPARGTRLLRPGAPLGRRQAYPYSESRLIPKNAEHGSRLYRCFKNGIRKMMH